MGDVLYGGEWVEQEGNFVVAADVAFEFEKSLEREETLKFDDDAIISVNDQKSAREVCRLCLDGPSSSFTDAQLLQGGHSIFLHSCRYQLTFPHVHGKDHKKQNTNNRTTQETVTSSFTLDLSIDFPPWASHLTKKSLRK